jgi:hypothetical protein
MTDTQSYDLIAYDIDTKAEVFRWENVPVDSGASYVAGTTIIDGTECWSVVGVHGTSTARLKKIDVRHMPAEFPSDAWMQYVKANGIGYAFTDSESKAMRFEGFAQANRLRERLAPQFPNYLWEVVAGSRGHCLVVRARK